MNKRPLVIVTGETKRSHQLAAELARQDLQVRALPTIQFEKQPLSPAGIRALCQIQSFDYLLFSSPRAVRFFKQTLRAQNIRMPKTKPCIKIIGPATELARVLPEVRGKKILFPRSGLASREAPRLLRRRGALVTLLPLYTTIAATPPRIMPFSPEDPPALILFLSRSGVAGFSKQVGRGTLKRAALTAQAVCLGPATARAAKAFGFKHPKVVLPSH